MRWGLGSSVGMVGVALALMGSSMADAVPLPHASPRARESEAVFLPNSGEGADAKVFLPPVTAGSGNVFLPRRVIVPSVLPPRRANVASRVFMPRRTSVPPRVFMPRLRGATSSVLMPIVVPSPRVESGSPVLLPSRTKRGRSSKVFLATRPRRAGASVLLSPRAEEDSSEVFLSTRRDDDADGSSALLPTRKSRAPKDP